MVDDMGDIKGGTNLREIFLTLIIFSIVFAGFVFAAHVIRTSSGGTSYNLAEDVGFIYNISVNNSDAGQTANITQLNITLPSGFTFIPGANGTTVQNYSFVNTSSVLSWSNFTYFLINGSDGSVLNYFWLNATAATPGNYNITITTLNGTGAFNSNISVTVNDTTIPSTIAFASPVETDGTNLSRNNIQVNVSATDNGVIDKIVVRLYNSTQALVNTSISSAGVASYFINFTSLGDGTYRFNATVNDTYNNLNNTATRLITLDTTPPNVSTPVSPVNGGNYSGTFVLNVSINDVTLSVNNVFFNLTNSSGQQNATFTASNSASTFWNATINTSNFADGTYNITVYANDTIGNLNKTIVVSRLTFDNTNPVPLFGTGTENSGVNVSRNWIYANVSVVETNEANITFLLYNSTGQYNSTTFTTAVRTINWTGLADGTYSYNVTARDYANNFNTTTTRTVTVDTAAPNISFVSPTPANNTINVGGNVTVNVTAADATLSIQTIRVTLYDSTNSLVNSSSSTISPFSINYIGLNAGTYSFNATVNDTMGNVNRTETRTLIVSSSTFKFNGTTLNVDGGFLNNSVINITIRSQNDWSVVGYSATVSNASGWFNISVPSNSQWMYEPKITHLNGSFLDYIGQSLPAFPSQMIQQVAGTSFYLKEGGSVNITAINSSASRISFKYQIKDQKLGYPIAQKFDSNVNEVVVNLPRDRNYSIMIYPDASMPVSFNWNNLSSTSSYNISNLSRYNATTRTLHYQFNTTTNLARVSGFINYSGVGGWNEFTVVPFLLEPGNMVHADFGDMPYNLSGFVGQTDFHNLTSGFYNISLPSTPAETSNILLFASARNGSTYYGGFKNISGLSGGLNQFNFSSMSILLGSASNISMDTITGSTINISTAKQMFNIVNSTNSTLSTVSGHIETNVDYSNLGAIEFTWMLDIQQGSTSTFYLPLLNATGIKEINAFVGGGDYAPKRVSYTQSQIQTARNITINSFNPQAISSTLTTSAITMALYISNSSCDIPNPASSCTAGSSTNMADHNPMKAIMGGGKLSFGMGTSGILVRYINVDMIASGPPDALFDSSTSEATSGTFASALRFGSAGPTIYDYVLVSIPYTEGSSSTTGLNETTQVNISIPTFYDDNWNVIWNSTANGTNVGALAGNNSHYSARAGEWSQLMNSTICTTANITSSSLINNTNPCYIDASNNRIWIRLPHFSGTGPSVIGNLITAIAAATTTTSSGGGGGEAGFWKGTIAYDSEDFSQRQPLTREYLKGYRARIKLGNEIHYMGVISLTNTSATINVSSTPQQTTLSIGELKKFEISGDNFYDMSVKLEGIKNNKANMTLSYIHEQISQTPANNATTTTPPVNNAEATAPVTPATETGTNSRAWIWITALVIVLVIIAAIIIAYYSYFRKQGYKYHHNAHSFYA